MLRIFLRDDRNGGPGEFTYAVFLDFCSLTQKDRIGHERSVRDAALFKLGLPATNVLYSHPATYVFKVTEMPKGYPEGYTFEPGMEPNRAAYVDRGWCFCEACLSELVKQSKFVLDSAKFTGTETDMYFLAEECTAGRVPPLPPSEFNVILGRKSFTSRSADLERVQLIYKSAYDARFRETSVLVYEGLSWADKEMSLLVRVFQSGVICRLDKMYLKSNAFGDGSLRIFATAIAGGNILSTLTELHLEDNPFTVEGTDLLAASLADNGLPSLKELWMDSLVHTSELKQVCATRGIDFDAIEPDELNIAGNEIVDVKQFDQLISFDQLTRGLTMPSRSEEDACILSYGAIISLQHVKTSFHLHSHSLRYPAGSEQQQVSCSDDVGVDHFWVVLPKCDADVKLEQGRPVADGGVIRLRHLRTGLCLHSHDVKAHVAGKYYQKEVSCFTSDDGNDEWKVYFFQSDEEEALLRLKHVDLADGKYRWFLHSHGRRYPEWGGRLQEVTVCAGVDDNDLWRARRQKSETLNLERLVASPPTRGMTISRSTLKAVRRALGSIC